MHIGCDQVDLISALLGFNLKAVLLLSTFIDVPQYA